MTSATTITTYLGEGLHSARPSSPAVPSGCTSIYYETDTGNTFVWSGSAWVQANGAVTPIDEAPWTLSTSAGLGLAWVNQGTAVAADLANGGFNLQNTPISNGVNNVSMLVLPVPGASTWSFKVRVKLQFPMRDYQLAGIGLYESGTTKCEVFGLHFVAGNAPVSSVDMQRYTTPTTYSSSAFTLPDAMAAVRWLRCDATGSAYNLYVSGDGWEWTQIFTESYTTLFTVKADHIGIGIDNQVASGTWGNNTPTYTPTSINTLSWTLG